MKKRTQSIGVATLLGASFVALKLTGAIDWPWIWVVSPVWIPVGMMALGAAMLFLLKFFGDGRVG